MKKPLAVGDRVRVYGNSFGGQSTSGQKGKITDLLGRDMKGWVEVEFDNPGPAYCFHRRQCVRLVPRKKPCPPQGERVYGVNAPRLELYAWEDAGKWACSREKPEFVRHKVYYRVVGCSEGEVPVSRETLAAVRAEEIMAKIDKALGEEK